MAAVFYSLALSSTETVLSFSKPVLYFRAVHLLTRPCEYISDSDEKKVQNKGFFLTETATTKKAHLSLLQFMTTTKKSRKCNFFFFNFKLSTLLKRHLVKEKSFDFHLEKGHSFLSVK